MMRWLGTRLHALLAWLRSRLGLARGGWLRGSIEVRVVPFAIGGLGVRAFRYSLYVPAGLPHAEKAPLIVVLHGCRQRASAFAVAAGLTRLADRTGARLLCPQQRRAANPYRCWNWFGPLEQSGAGELEVVLAMLDDAGTRVAVEQDRVAVVGLSAGGALAALLAFHAPRRIRSVTVVAAPPLLGNLVPQDPRDVMRRGLPFAPELALPLRQGRCAPLLIIQGTADAMVHPRCAAQLAAQALESLRRAGIAVTRAEATGPGSVTTVDYRGRGGLCLRRIDVPGLGHEWTGGPGGHAYCARGGAPLAELCARFLRDTGVLRGRTTEIPRSTARV